MGALAIRKATFDALTNSRKTALRTAAARLRIGDLAVYTDGEGTEWLIADDPRIGAGTEWVDRAAAAGYPDALLVFPGGPPSDWEVKPEDGT